MRRERFVNVIFRREGVTPSKASSSECFGERGSIRVASDTVFSRVEIRATRSVYRESEIQDARAAGVERASVVERYGIARGALVLSPAGVAARAAQIAILFLDLYPPLHPCAIDSKGVFENHREWFRDTRDRRASLPGSVSFAVFVSLLFPISLNYGASRVYIYPRLVYFGSIDRQEVSPRSSDGKRTTFETVRLSVIPYLFREFLSRSSSPVKVARTIFISISGRPVSASKICPEFCALRSISFAADAISFAFGIFRARVKNRRPIRGWKSLGTSATRITESGAIWRISRAKMPM